ncbi:MAG: phage major capsid protein [Verrucomicrobia bacterium]|nr:phage major capsid protein [Verrucomicrobiota bacterium]
MAGLRGARRYSWGMVITEHAATFRGLQGSDPRKTGPANLHEYSLVSALRSLDPQSGNRPVRGPEARFDKAARQAFEGLPAEGFFAPWSALRSLRSTHTAGQFNLGGALIEETPALSEMGPALRPASFAVGAGMRTIQANGPLLVPRWSSALTATWVAESQAVPSVDATLAQLSLSPRAVGCSVTLSGQALTQTDGALEEFLRSELRAAIAQAIDTAVCTGAGGAEPVGIVNAPNVSRDVTFGGAATWANVLSFERELGLDNVEDAASLRWIMSHETRARWKAKERATGSGFLMEGEYCNGYRAHTSNCMAGAGGKVAFGAFSEVYCATWGPGVQIIVDNLTQAPNRLVKLTAFALVDIGIRRPVCWQVSNDSGAQ